LDDPTAIRKSFSLTSSQESVLIAGYTRGFKRVFLFCCGCGAVSFVIAVSLIKHHDLARKDDKELKQQSKNWLEQRKERRQRDGKLENGLVSNQAENSK
jgi:hypothetical protein